MELVIKYLEAYRESILMDLDLIKNDTKTRYAIEKRKQLEPMLEQVTSAVAILSSVPQANELLPHVSGWLSVKEYNPPTHHVLCYNKHSGIEVSQSTNDSFKYVTHWMELPDNPACR